MIDIFSQLFLPGKSSFQVNISFLKGPYYNEYIKSEYDGLLQRKTGRRREHETY